MTNQNVQSIIFHIGGPKTGSSAIQSWLAKNRVSLKKLGLDYAEDPEVKVAAHNRVTSGNAKHIAKNPSKASIKDGQLWSAEQLFVSDDFRNSLGIIASRLNNPIVICGYYRDPYEWLQSSYAQGIKGKGFHHSFDEHLNSQGLIRLGWLQNWVESPLGDNVELRLFNYDRHKEHLLSHFVENCLGVDAAKLDSELAVINRVNRSLTAGETALLVEINRHHGSNSHLASQIWRGLVEDLPDLKSEQPRPSRDEYMRFIETADPLVTRLDEYLLPGEKLKLEEEVLFLESDTESVNVPVE